MLSGRAILLSGALLLGGCANQPRASDAGGMTGAPAGAFHVRAGEYVTAFDRTRDRLRDLGFLLERVDAQAGVISTQPKGTGGFATPWDREQSGLNEEFEDMFQRHRRVVRVEFTPAGVAPNPADLRDLRAEKGPIDAQITATVYRWNQPGWRLNTLAILDSSHTHDPALDERGMSSYSVAVRQDTPLAAWIAERVRLELDKPQASK